MAKRVLLIDDEKDFLKIMGERIRTWGYDLIAALTAKEAIDALITKHPNIIILDYRFPDVDVDGVTILKKIRKIDNKIPVIMFTAYPDGKSIEGTEKLGVIAYIPKYSVYSNAQATLKEAIYLAERKLDKK